MKEHQIYNSAIDDVLEQIILWWNMQTTTQDLINRIKKLKHGAVHAISETEKAE